MMIRSFLRICHIAQALLLGGALLASAGTTAGERNVGTDIGKFMAGYTHDLARRLGPGARVEYSAPNIAASADTRSCAKPLRIDVRSQTQSLSRVTLFVACGDAWSIYVPIDLDVYRPVVVTTRPLATGTVVVAGDVELNALDVSQLVGTYLTTLDDVVGMGVKRPIGQGRPVFAQQLEPPLLVHRGDSVVISASTGGLAVKMTGTALTDGHRGEQIRIKNQSTSRIIDARVVAPGHVVVPM